MGGSCGNLWTEKVDISWQARVGVSMPLLKIQTVYLSCRRPGTVQKLLVSGTPVEYAPVASVFISSRVARISSPVGGAERPSPTPRNSTFRKATSICIGDYLASLFKTTVPPLDQKSHPLPKQVTF